MFDIHYDCNYSLIGFRKNSIIYQLICERKFVTTSWLFIFGGPASTVRRNTNFLAGTVQRLSATTYSRIDLVTYVWYMKSTLQWFHAVSGCPEGLAL